MPHLLQLATPGKVSTRLGRGAIGFDGPLLGLTHSQTFSAKIHEVMDAFLESSMVSPQLEHLLECSFSVLSIETRTISQA